MNSAGFFIPAVGWGLLVGFVSLCIIIWIVKSTRDNSALGRISWCFLGISLVVVMAKDVLIRTNAIQINGFWPTDSVTVPVLVAFFSFFLIYCYKKSRHPDTDLAKKRNLDLCICVLAVLVLSMWLIFSGFTSLLIIGGLLLTLLWTFFVGKLFFNSRVLRVFHFILQKFDNRWILEEFGDKLGIRKISNQPENYFEIMLLNALICIYGLMISSVFLGVIQLYHIYFK